MEGENIQAVVDVTLKGLCDLVDGIAEKLDRANG